MLETKSPIPLWTFLSVFGPPYWFRAVLAELIAPPRSPLLNDDSPFQLMEQYQRPFPTICPRGDAPITPPQTGIFVILL